jgi:N-methylhydantoinase A
VLLGVDVGGTFTDAVLAADGRLITSKAPSTPHDQSEGVLEAVRSVLDEHAARTGGRHDGSSVRVFGHGTTVVTNALLEGKAARTVLVATEGFEDLVELGRQARADLYRLCAAHPDPLVPPDRRVAAPERTGPDGVLRALEDPAAVAEAVAAHDPEAVAVCLLHSYTHPEHERSIGEALAQRLPGVHVSLSSRAVGTFREYERAATTEVDAALSPLLGNYLRRLTDRASEAGLPEPTVMQSSGGLAEVREAAAHAARTVLSGPAAGAAGAAWAATVAGEPDVVCFDMGGTSCDVCVIEDGAVRESAGRPVGGRPVALPMLDLHTVGAGGGSIGWRDAGGALRVGPRSAGADPGPACYGRGGTEPTVTDAHLLLGHLGEELAGGVRLDRSAAERAVERLGIEPEGIVRVATAEMARAIRVMTVERGVDPRDMALMAFGGAGGLHAVAIAEELGIQRVLCPRASGVLAALGLVVGERRRDAQRSVLTTDLSEGPRVAADLAERVALEGGEVQARFDLRYRGQAFELTVEEPDADVFAAAHEQAYGFRDPEAEVELVTVRVRALVAGADVTPDREGTVDESRRETAMGHARVLRGPLPPGLRAAGPAVLELPESTLVVPESWAAEVLEGGTVRVTR